MFLRFHKQMKANYEIVFVPCIGMRDMIRKFAISFVHHKRIVSSQSLVYIFHISFAHQVRFQVFVS
jgi:hypothetical protein